MQMEVVSAVNAESELEYVLAISPTKNKIHTVTPRYCMANIGKSSSDNSGNGIFCFAA